MIFWDDSNSAFFNELDKYDCPKTLCLTTDPQNFENLRKLNAVYCESIPIYNAVRQQGIRAIRAFGTDTKFFKPAPEVTKNILYFYPATFSPWKRQRDIAKLGWELLCVGTVQPDGVEDLDTCIQNDVRVEIGYFPAEKILEYYQRSRNVIIPAVHGSERTVLEAMACDILPTVTNENNVRAQSYIREYQLSSCKSPRQFILSNYSHKKYATDILKGLE